MPYVSTDWGTVVQPRASKEAPERGGWSVFFTFWAGMDTFNPGVHQSLRGNGQQAWFGWPAIPKLEEPREQWLEAPDPDARKEIAREIRAVAEDELPYVPVGACPSMAARRRNPTDRVEGLALYLGIKRS
jgi:peptide/nickel transport system substrate-binding protein